VDIATLGIGAQIAGPIDIDESDPEAESGIKTFRLVFSQEKHLV
jgi:hypothetical protein